MDGKNILLGNRKLMLESNISLENLEETSHKLAGEGKTPMYIAIDIKMAEINKFLEILLFLSESSRKGLLKNKTQNKI